MCKTAFNFVTRNNGQKIYSKLQTACIACVIHNYLNVNSFNFPKVFLRLLFLQEYIYIYTVFRLIHIDTQGLLQNKCRSTSCTRTPEEMFFT